MEQTKKITFQTKEGRSLKVLFRQADSSDFQLLTDFYKRIPPSELYLFDEDILDPNVVERRLSDTKTRAALIMLALLDNQIIGECSLRRNLQSRSAHVGELQFYVLPEYRSYGVGFTLLKDVTHIALTEGIEKLYGYIPSKVVSSFERLIGKLGFQQEAILKNYIKDSSGRKQDLFIFGKDLEELWNKIADWQSPYGRAMEF